MARALPTTLKFVFEGTEAAPGLCICDYIVEDGDLSEPRADFQDLAPTTDQSVTAMLTAAATTIASNEGI